MLHACPDLAAARDCRDAVATIELEQRCIQRCLKRVSAWRGAACCWGTWMMSDDNEGQQRPGFPVVVLPGVAHMPDKGEDEQEATWVFYAAATRATHRLLLGTNEHGKWTKAFT